VFAGSYEDVRPLSEEAIALAWEGEEWDMVAAGASLAAAGSIDVDRENAESLIAEADVAASRTGNPFAIAMVALGHGRILGMTGRADEARKHLEVAIARFAELGDERLGLAARSDLGHALRRAGRTDEAESVYRRVIGGWVHLGNRGAVANLLEQSAFIAIDRADASRAARLLGAAEAIREQARAPMAMQEIDEHASFVERLRSEAPLAVVDPAWAAGRAMSMSEAVAFATPG
jgi:hypothetical protein